MLEDVARETEMGRLIGNGPDAVGRHFGNRRVPTVKGQSIAGYDPRAMPGMGVTYATSPMGADHTAGFVGGATGSTEMLINTSRSLQIHMAAIDSMGLCMFAQSGGMETLLNAVAATLGKPFGFKEWEQLGHRCLKAEIDFNRRAGLSDVDERLPGFFHKESLPPLDQSLPYQEDDLHGIFADIRKLLEERK
jgi:aldehyde:ferredoxin oxidoreductase